MPRTTLTLSENSSCDTKVLHLETHGLPCDVVCPTEQGIFYNTKATMEICRHCTRPRIALRSRGLCYKCYLDIEIRNLYPAPLLNRNFGNGSGDNEYGGMPFYPTQALPGTVEKILVLQERASKNQCLWHPADRGSDAEGVMARLGKCVQFTNVLHAMDDKALPSDVDI